MDAPQEGRQDPMIRRFLTRLLLLVLVAACGWNWLTVQQLSAQVTQLQAARHSLQAARQSAQRLPTPPPSAAAPGHFHSQAARLGLPRLQARWKHLQRQVNALRSQAEALRSQSRIFRSAGRKVFHEII